MSTSGVGAHYIEVAGTPVEIVRKRVKNCISAYIRRMVGFASLLRCILTTTRYAWP